MLSRNRFCCYMCLPNALLLRWCGLHILPTLLFITLAYFDYFSADFEPKYHGFEYPYFFLCFFICYNANSTLLSLLRFSYFIPPYDAQASSAFSALITYATKRQKQTNVFNSTKCNWRRDHAVLGREHLVKTRSVCATMWLTVVFLFLSLRYAECR